MTTAWYATHDVLPPVNVGVIVWWTQARPPFDAARVVHPKLRRPLWLTHDAGQAVFLPSSQRPVDDRRPWAGWHTLKGEHPAYWRPRDATRWALALPPPAFVDDGVERPTRMWSATTRFDAVDAAEAAELAAEMERDRDDARSGPGPGHTDGAGEPVARQWWRDPHAVSYAAPGAISRREAEGRLMRALAAETWVRVERPRCATFAGILARLSATLPLSPADLAAQDPPPDRTPPTGRDQDDMLIALGWLAALHGQPRPRRAIRLRASDLPMGWREIGRRLGCSHETARAAYRTGIDDVWAAANGWPTAGTTAVAAILADVRAANRAHRKAS